MIRPSEVQLPGRLGNTEILGSSLQMEFFSSFEIFTQGVIKE